MTGTEPYKLLRIVHQEDVQVLPEHAQRLVVQELAKIREDPHQFYPVPPPKDYQVVKRSLADCRAARVYSDYYHELRIVYRIHEEERAIEVVAIAPRLGSKVYQLAAERLSDEPDEEPVELPRWAINEVRRKRRKL